MDNLLYIAGALIVLVAFYFYTKKLAIEQKEREIQEHDARSHVVNDSSYNIDHEGIDGHRTEGLTKAEAQEAVEDFKNSDGPMPSREEFHAVREDLNKP